jgi:hypothetical protein
MLVRAEPDREVDSSDSNDSNPLILTKVTSLQIRLEGSVIIAEPRCIFSNANKWSDNA